MQFQVSCHSSSSGQPLIKHPLSASISDQTAVLFKHHASSSARLIILLSPCLIVSFSSSSSLRSRNQPGPLLSSSPSKWPPSRSSHSFKESSSLAGTPLRDEIASIELPLALSLVLLLLRLTEKIVRRWVWCLNVAMPRSTVRDRMFMLNLAAYIPMERGKVNYEKWTKYTRK